MDVLHDGVQTVVHLLACPAQTLAVLRHLQTADTNTTGIGSLTWSIENLSLLEYADGTRRGRHIGSLAHGKHTVGYECLGSLLVDLVLSGRGKCDVGLLEPRLGTLHIFGCRILLGILLDTSAIDVLELHDIVEFLAVDAVGIIHVSVGVAHGHNLSAQLQNLLGRVLSHIACSADQHALALQLDTASLEHLAEEIDVAVASGFRTDE